MIETWFPTPIYYEDIGSDDISAEITAHLAKNPLNSALSMWQDNVDTTFSYGEGVNQNALMDSCPTFKAAVLDSAYEYLRAFNTPPKARLEIVESWANMSKKGQYQNFHEHGATHMSGVYYHRSTGAPEQGQLVFKAPASVMSVSPLMLREQNRVFYAPIQGRVILFPSFLLHSVMVNRTDNTRISCSFNLILR